jgi:hypothetical protein
MNADFVTMVNMEKTCAPALQAIRAPEPDFATLTVKPRVSRADPAVDADECLPTLRQRLKSLQPPPLQIEERGFLARLLEKIGVRRRR